VDEETKVFLTLELGYTACRKEEGGDISNCQLKDDSVMLIKYIYPSSMLLLDSRGLIEFRKLKISY